MVSSQASAAGLHEPYKDDAINIIYNLLFCDDPSLLKKINNDNNAEPGPLDIIFQNPNEKRVQELADDVTEESRSRLLAYHWLRENNQPVKEKKLLGVVIEVSFEDGLDTLAAYSDGSVRYINHADKLITVEPGGSATIEKLAQNLVKASVPVIQRIGPWEEERLPPPALDNIRLTFLASDGLYFGEGSFDKMQDDAMAKPVVQKATELLVLITGTVGDD